MSQRKLISDQISGPGLSNPRLLNWAKAAFAGSVIALGMAMSPAQVQAQETSALHATPVAISAIYDANPQIQSALQELRDAFDGNLLDVGVAQFLPKNLKAEKEIILHASSAQSPNLFRAISQEQAQVSHDPDTQKYRALAQFRGAVVDGVDDVGVQLALESALTLEATLCQSRDDLRLGADQLSAPQMIQAIDDRIETLESMQARYEQAARTIQAIPAGQSALAQQIRNDALDYAKTIQGAIDLSQQQREKLTQLPFEQLPEHAGEIVNALTMGDLGQRVMTKHEFLLAQRDSQGNVLPGEVNLDAPFNEAQSLHNPSASKSNTLAMARMR